MLARTLSEHEFKLSSQSFRISTISTVLVHDVERGNTGVEINFSGLNRNSCSELFSKVGVLEITEKSQEAAGVEFTLNEVASFEFATKLKVNFATSFS